MKGLVPLVLAALCSPLAAQTTWIVDARGGTGTSFTDLPPAIAAASPGDTLLIRASGSTPYTGAVIDKGLRLLGEAGALLGTTRVANLPTGQTLVCHGLTFVDPPYPPPSLGSLPTRVPALEVDTCSGPVLLEDCEVLCAEIRDSSRVNFAGCRIRTPELPTITGSSLGNPFAQQVTTLRIERSEVALSRSQLVSSNGASAIGNQAASQVPGLVVLGGLVTFTDCSLTFEYAAAGCFPFVGQPVIAGPIHVIAADAGSRVEFGAGTSVTQQNSGGTSAAFPFTCIDTTFPWFPVVNSGTIPAPLPLLPSPLGPYVLDPNATIATTQSVPGGSVLSMTARADATQQSIDIAVFAPSFRTTAVFVSIMNGRPVPTLFGDIWLDSGPMFLVATGTQNGSGEYRVTIPYAPAAYPSGTPLAWQAVMIDPVSQGLTLTRPTISVLR